MAIFTLQEAREMRQIWLTAYKHAAAGKSYTIENRSVSYQDLPLIKKELGYWDDIIADLTGQRGRGMVKRVVIADL
jgi:hypothetical protein